MDSGRFLAAWESPEVTEYMHPPHILYTARNSEFLELRAPSSSVEKQLVPNQGLIPVADIGE